jgi:hydroxymethylpyrimidine pyrophosphatase-like HAD family hydrolase
MRQAAGRSPERTAEPAAVSAAGPCALAERAGGIELVVTDLDGTLWDGTGRIHPRTLEALGHLAACSVPVLAATGRSARSAWPVMQANGVALPGVFLDGAVGLEFGSKTPLFRHGFAPELAAAVLEIFEQLGVSPCISVDGPGRDIVLGPHPMTHPEYLHRLLPWVREEDPRTAVRTLRVLAFSVLGTDPGAVRELAQEVTSRAPVAAAISPDRTYGGVHLSFRPIGVHKWAGVLAFCAYRELDASAVLAIGDADNDIEMLEGAAVSFAVSDATVAARERADHLCAPASEGGWADLVGFLARPGG